MGGPDNFHIQLQGHGIYYGGQTIQGQVQISSCEYMSNIKSVQIKLSGFANVHWTEQVRKRRRRSDGRGHEHYYHTYAGLGRGTKQRVHDPCASE